MVSGTTCNLHLVKQTQRMGNSTRRGGGVCTSAWSYGHKHGTARLHPTPDGTSLLPVTTQTPHAPVPTRPRPPPSHADARRTSPSSRNDHVCAEPSPVDPH
ncbi:hypothetical protein SKAU_G00334620 [Synaphobranchus kaupii]|uniref:Uncharacterized protein n=1 Tax=Synaphobranchus kaupii TaxID=118154 RepID=A0A9Q1ELR7_SYNKA|nr:hypothetical protein SKAU_G00334620 [Synaphobranchus kaupii]